MKTRPSAIALTLDHRHPASVGNGTDELGECIVDDPLEQLAFIGGHWPILGENILELAGLDDFRLITYLLIKLTQIGAVDYDSYAAGESACVGIDLVGCGGYIITARGGKVTH